MLVAVAAPALTVAVAIQAALAELQTVVGELLVAVAAHALTGLVELETAVGELLGNCWGTVGCCWGTVGCCWGNVGCCCCPCANWIG
jgi:hypothetical protein